MSAPLHLVQMRLDAAALMRFAADQRLNLHQDEDGGYALHAWMAAMFGADAPKPFRWFEQKAEVLGYAACDHHALSGRARAFANPIAHAALLPDALHSKIMPGAWAVGQRLKIDVLACPVSRRGATEKDVYLRELDRQADAARGREAVYLDWFRSQWTEAVEFESLSLRGFARSRTLRRGRAEDRRTSRMVERPRALFNGVVAVRDGNRFHELLGRGIGRHRAFGYGMVLLAPPP